jgi:heparanase
VWKQLFGTRVLDVENSLTTGRSVRVYAFCTNTNSDYPSGSVTVLALNVNNSTQSFNIDLLGLTASSYTRDEFHFTAPNSDITSPNINLNGNTLYLQPGNELPAFVPVQASSDDAVTLAPLSVAYIVLAGVNAPGCL